MALQEVRRREARALQREAHRLEVPRLGDAVPAVRQRRAEASDGVTARGAGLDMPNVVTVDPEDIAKAVVDTVRTRRAEVIVPRWLGSAVNLTNTLPRSLQQAARTAAGGSRQAAGALNSAERTAYLKRVAGQVTDS